MSAVASANVASPVPTSEPTVSAATAVLSLSRQAEKDGAKQAESEAGKCWRRSNREGVSATHSLPPQGKPELDFTLPHQKKMHQDRQI